MKTEYVRSKNTVFLRTLALKNTREKRTKHGEFLVEGVRSITGAVRKGWSISAFLYAKGAKLSSWAQDILATSRAQIHYELTPELLEEISDKEETSELLAIVKIPPDAVDRIPLSKDMVVVVFDRPGSPGNLGSSIRSCDALGVSGAIITGHAADLYHPHAVRGSMGSLFSVPTVRLPSHKEVQSWIGRVQEKFGEVCVVGTSEDGEKLLYEHSFTGPTILIMGNETFGMGANYRALCNLTVRIPMQGSASSLNVSCATTVCLYELMRQRLRQRLKGEL